MACVSEESGMIAAPGVVVVHIFELPYSETIRIG